VCPQLSGFQTLEELSPMGRALTTKIGFCGAWSMFFAEFVLMNPTKTSKELMTHVFTKLKEKENMGNYVFQVIRGYVYVIKKIFDEKLQFIVGEDMSYEKYVTLDEKERDHIYTLMAKYNKVNSKTDSFVMSVESNNDQLLPTQKESELITEKEGKEWGVAEKENDLITEKENDLITEKENDLITEKEDEILKPSNYEKTNNNKKRSWKFWKRGGGQSSKTKKKKKRKTYKIYYNSRNKTYYKRRKPYSQKKKPYLKNRKIMRSKMI
jgi:hypothetical protein